MADINSKTTILPENPVSSTGGETYKYESNMVGGAKHNKRKSKKTKKVKRSVRKTKKVCLWKFW